MTLPNVTCVTATYNRHYHLERVVKMFLDQDYEGDHLLLIYNNNPVKQELAPIKLPKNKRILLVNNHLSRKTGLRYQNLGEIYNDILNYVPTNTDIICHMDDDDSYLPYHISEGVRGLQKAQNITVNYIAYKPQQSYYRDTEWKVRLAGNTLEPSIFVLARYIFEHGYKETTTDQHFGWYEPLIKDNLLYTDPTGIPTLIYQWMGDVWKTSGDPGNPNNWGNCREYKGDIGDRIVTPVSDEEIKPYYQVG